ncbi:MAG: ABC transporter ATP-binding protein [Gemmatimonadetes bacterium]|nr:ABC transporter ATP-binding protein [Gemmatimonadota bacterium]NNM04721.1 ABC transporter ATP-binding protein [Gemmatimonadota bacterium]
MNDLSTSGTVALVRVEGLSKSYREGGHDHVILSDATASLFRGEFVALLGPSGSGKSTLLNLLSGIDAPDSGTVIVDGVPLTEISERERTLFRRRHIGFIFQFFNLLPTLTVEENLLLPLELSGKIGVAERRKALDLLDQVGLAGRESTFPDRLSGGEQQRVAVARALVHQPALVLADEPTGNLDSKTGASILSLLQNLASDRGATLLVVTHSQEVAAAAHRVLRIHDGRLAEEAVELSRS